MFTLHICTSNLMLAANKEVLISFKKMQCLLLSSLYITKRWYWLTAFAMSSDSILSVALWILSMKGYQVWSNVKLPSNVLAIDEKIRDKTVAVAYNVIYVITGRTVRKVKKVVYKTASLLSSMKFLFHVSAQWLTIYKTIIFDAKKIIKRISNV